MAKGMVKYDSKTRVTIIELASKGYYYHEIADRLGISRSTIYRWCKKDDKLDKVIKEVRAKAFKEIAEVGLFERIRGAERTEITDEYVIEGEDGKVIKRKVRTIREASDLNAIKLGAKIYMPDLDDSSDTTSNVTNILNYNTSGYSLRELQEDLKDSPIERVEASDISDLEYVEVDSVLDGSVE